jgi:hypothetical protein
MAVRSLACPFNSPRAGKSRTSHFLIESGACLVLSDERVVALEEPRFRRRVDCPGPRLYASITWARCANSRTSGAIGTRQNAAGTCIADDGRNDFPRSRNGEPRIATGPAYPPTTPRQTSGHGRTLCTSRVVFVDDVKTDRGIATNANLAR